MEDQDQNKESYFKAKESVKQIKIFYMHLVGYFIVVLLLLYNLYIVQGEYKNVIIWLDSIVLVLWTIFIIIHGWRVFKGKIFKKSWEDRKIQEFIEKDKKRKQWK